MSVSKEFVRYCVVGVTTNLIGFGLYFCLCMVGIGPLKGMTIAYCLTILGSYLLNYKWSFRRKSKSSYIQVLKYIAVSGVGYSSNLILLYIATQMVNLNPLWSQTFIIGLVAIELYTLNRIYVFKDSVQNHWN